MGANIEILEKTAIIKGVPFLNGVGAVSYTHLENTLRYMEISPKYTQEEEKEVNSDYVTVPNVTNEEFSQAAGIIAGKGLKYKVSPEKKNDGDFKVVDQYPKAGTKLKKGGTVYLYRE